MYKCDCGRDAKVEKMDGGFYMTCERGHTLKLSFGEVEQSLRQAGLNVDAMLDAPARAATEIFKTKRIPPCFGTLSPFSPYRRPFDFTSLPDMETAEDAFAKVLDDLVEKEKQKAIQYSHCNACVCFERCRAISPDFLPHSA